MFHMTIIIYSQRLHPASATPSRIPKYLAGSQHLARKTLCACQMKGLTSPPSTRPRLRHQDSQQHNGWPGRLPPPLLPILQRLNAQPDKSRKHRPTAADVATQRRRDTRETLLARQR